MPKSDKPGFVKRLLAKVRPAPAVEPIAEPVEVAPLDVPAPLPPLDPTEPNAVIEDIGPVVVEEYHAFLIRYEGRTYSHVGEDADGRWVYRAL